MYITLIYRDVPELSILQRNSVTEIDECTEKELLLNPDCYARILMEFVRNKCKLGSYTNFDLCDESGQLLGLLKMPSHAYATNLFQHKKTYYIVVIRTEKDRQVTYLPQLSHQNPRYSILKENVLKCALPVTARGSVGDNSKQTQSGAKSATAPTPTVTTKSKKK